MTNSVSTDLHLVLNDKETACHRVYARTAYRNDSPKIRVAARSKFSTSPDKPCEQCKRKYQISQLKIRRAASAYTARLEIGPDVEIALRDTRQEFDLSEDEEQALFALVGNVPQVFAIETT